MGTKEYGVYTTENAQTETNEGAVSAGRTINIQYKSKGVRIWHKVTCSTVSRVDHVIKSPWVELETSTLPLSETKGDESKSLSVTSVNIGW